MSLTLNNTNRKTEVEQADISRDIIERSKKGSRQAQYQLYKMYSRAMFNICYRMMNDREDAEDMLQESFTEAFLKLDTFRFESAFGAWLKRITINKCINAIKKRRVNLTVEEHIPDAPAELNPNEEIPGLSVEKVRKAMAQLPDGYRMVFSLYLLEGYDHAEISQIMGISEATSKSQYSRAKKRIKEIIKNQSYA